MTDEAWNSHVRPIARRADGRRRPRRGGRARPSRPRRHALDPAQRASRRGAVRAADASATNTAWVRDPRHDRAATSRSGGYTGDTTYPLQGRTLALFTLSSERRARSGRRHAMTREPSTSNAASTSASADVPARRRLRASAASAGASWSWNGCSRRSTTGAFRSSARAAKSVDGDRRRVRGRPRPARRRR